MPFTARASVTDKTKTAGDRRRLGSRNGAQTVRRSGDGMTAEMPQLVRVAHDINCDNFAILDL